MTKANDKYGAVEFNVNWTGTSLDQAKVANARDVDSFWTEIGAHFTAVERKEPSGHGSAAHQRSSYVTKQGTETVRLDSTQQEVDAYVSSLEAVVSPEQVRMRLDRAKHDREPMIMPVPRSSSCSLFWYVVAAIVCVVLLLRLLE